MRKLLYPVVVLFWDIANIPTYVILALRKGLNSISPLGTWSELIIVNEARNRLLQARAL